MEEGISFEYDPVKSAINHQKHGIDFYEAMALWESEVLELPSYPGSDEGRWLVIGTITEKCWTVVITRRGERVRIISARRSRKEEERLYHERYAGAADDLC